MTTGHSKYGADSLNQTKETQLDKESQKFGKELKSFKYSKGIFGFIFILILSIGAFCLAYFYGKKHVVDCLTIGSGIGFFLSLAWLVIRQSFGLKMKYSTRKFAQFLTFKSKRMEKNLVNLSLAINNINTFEEYQTYVLYQKRNSAIAFYFTIAFFTIFFIICIILSFTII